MHLAASSSFKQTNKSGTTPPGSETTPSSLIRNSVMGSFKANSSSSSISQISTQQSTSDFLRGNQSSRASITSRSGSSQQIQQLLPYRLSEGSTNKTSSLPRGVGSRSVSSMMSQMEQSAQLGEQTNNSHLRTSVSTSQFPSGGSGNTNVVPGESLTQPNSSFLYGPANNRTTTRTYYVTDSQLKPGNSNGYAEFSGTPHENIPIVHRRSGSSPVPMSSAPVRRTAAPEIHYHQHPFFKPRDDDETKILFL
jgi:hypothetical protein